MTISPLLQKLLVCPACKGSLELWKERAELACPTCRLAYPVRDGIPIMVRDDARVIDG